MGGRRWGDTGGVIDIIQKHLEDLEKKTNGISG